MLFNNFKLEDTEILKIIKDYEPLINKNSIINAKIDEDLRQEINLAIYKELKKNK